MEEAWQVKCSTGWLEPQALPVLPSLAGASCNQMNMNAQQFYHPGVAQVANLGDSQMLQEQLLSRTFNMDLGKSGFSEAGNTFLSLLSGHSYHLSGELLHPPNSRLELSKLPVPDTLGQSSSGSFSSNSISSSKYYHNNSIFNGELSSLIASQPLFSTSSRASDLQDHQPFVSHSGIFGSSEAVSKHSSEDITRGIGVPSRRFGSSSLSCSAIQHKNIQASPNLPSDANVHGLIPPLLFRGRPRVLCMNTAGELFVNDMGLLGVLCSCHSLPMSVAKFCQHSGLPSTIPGDVIRMESGMTLSQWCKMCFGNLASGDHRGSDQSKHFTAELGSIGSNAFSFSSLSKNQGTSNSFETINALGRSGELRKNSLSGYHPSFVGQGTMEKPACNDMDYEYENRDPEGKGLHLAGLTQSAIPIRSENNSLQVMKRTPEFLNIKGLHSTSNRQEPNAASQPFPNYVNFRTRSRNTSVSYAPLGPKKIFIHDKCNSMGVSPSNEAFVFDSDGSDLRLGQPSQDNHYSLSFFPTDISLPLQTVCSSSKALQQNQLSDITDCSREAKRARLYQSSPLSEASNSGKRPSHPECRTAFHNSESEDLMNYATKDSSISLFLSHLTGGTGISDCSNKTHNEISNVASSINCDYLSSRENQFWCTRNEFDEIGKASSFNEFDCFNNKGNFSTCITDNSKNVVENNEVHTKQIEDRRVKSPLINGQCFHSCHMDMGKSSWFSNQPFRSLHRGSDAKNSKKHGKVAIFEDVCLHRNVVQGSEIQASWCTGLPGCPESRAPIARSSKNFNNTPETSCLSYKQNIKFPDHLMDGNSRFLASGRHESLMAKQEQGCTSFKVKPQHGRLCCLSAMGIHRNSCTDDLVEHKDGTHCNIDQNKTDSHSVTNCCRNNTFVASHCENCSVVSNNCNNCPASAQRRSPHSTISSYHVCGTKHHLCFRPREISIDASLDNVEYDMCMHNGGLPVRGNCCCATFSRCLAGCSLCGVVNTADTMNDPNVNVTLKNLNPTFDNEAMFKKGTVELEQCTCFKKMVGTQNNCQNGFWRNASGKIIGCSAATHDNHAMTSDAACKELDGTFKASMSLDAQQISNRSGYSDPAITEVSVEVNKDAQISNVNTGMALPYSEFDEESGIQKGSSSDEMPNTKSCKLVDTSSISGYSCYNVVDELKFCGSSKQKRARTIITDQENCQRQQLTRVWNLGKRKESSKQDKHDDSIPDSAFILGHSKPVDYVNGVKCLLPSSKRERVSMQPENIVQGTVIVSSGSSNIKQKLSNFHPKLVSLKKLENINPHSNNIRSEEPKISVPMEAGQNFSRQGKKDSLKRLSHLNGERPPKYISLSRIVDSRNNETAPTLSKRPVICDNSGIISRGEINTLQKPAKIVPLNLVLKKARRCTSNCVVEHKQSLISILECTDGKDQQCRDLSSCKLLDDCENPYLGRRSELGSGNHFMPGMESHLSKLDFRKGIKGTWYASIQSRSNSMNHKDGTGDQWQMHKIRSCMSPCSVREDLCCVCGSSKNEPINCLLECNRCMIRVHQACYGIIKVPMDVWYCKPCKTNSHNIACVLCGYDGGAMTQAMNSTSIVRSLLKVWKITAGSTSRSRTLIRSQSIKDKVLNPNSLELDAAEYDKHAFLPSNGSRSFKVIFEAASDNDNHNQKKTIQEADGVGNKFNVHNSIIDGVFDPSVMQWVHVVCGLWTPGARCPNVDTMNTFDVCDALPARKNIVCSLCCRPGGSCIGCRVTNCSIHFHPWCAHQKGLLQSEVDDEDNEKVGFYGKCMLHARNDFHFSDRQSMNVEALSPRIKKWSCARTEGFKGRGKGFFPNYHNSFNDGDGCIVSQVQINAWLHINGKRSFLQHGVTSVCSDVEHDLRKEYIRYKLSKGWKHLVVYNSGIHDLGLYTSQFITRGAMVVEYVGEVVGLRVADKREIEYQSGRLLQCKSACYFFRIDKEHIIDATRKGGIARYVNHSCLPNCVAKIISIKYEKKVVFFAERDINPGEEITYDYHFNREEEGEKIPCFCNSKNCRRYLN